jgi:hypothetical protein
LFLFMKKKTHSCLLAVFKIFRNPKITGFLEFMSRGL